MKYNLDEKILQGEKMVFSNSCNVRMQIKETSYTITLDLDSERFKNGHMEVAKKGIRVSLKLKESNTEKSRRIIVNQKITNVSQLSQDLIQINNDFCYGTITIQLSAIARPNVKKNLKSFL